MVPADDSSSDVQRSALIHREMLQLGVLILMSVAAFFITRAVAASNRDMSLHDAAEWYGRGQQQIDAGRVDDAVDSFRRATVRNRTDKRYVLALSRALALKHDDEAARSALLTLRESAPEDAEINLDLARLAAHRQDVTEASRFYHNALYAPWPIEQAGARRRVRVELVRFLLTHKQSGRALSELFALSTDLPDEAPAHLEVAQLFAEAGDDRHALDHFQRALRLSPDNGTALAGAGRSAFQLGNYVLAAGYLRRAPPTVDDVTGTRELVDLVLAHDPLATRIGSLERRRRLIADLSYAQQRLVACLGQRSAGSHADDAAALAREAETFLEGLKRPAASEQDTIESGVDVMDRASRAVAHTCGTPTALDRALLLIARAHETDTR